MKLRIALIGNLPDDRGLVSKIDVVFGQLLGYMETGGTHLDAEAIVSPSYTGENWKDFISERNLRAQSILKADDKAWETPLTTTLRIETTVRTLIGENICNRSDAAVVCWGEDVTELSGAVWEFLYMAYQKKIPCIWISGVSGEVYCLDETYYQTFTVQYLNKTMEPLTTHVLPDKPQPLKGAMAFWNRLRRKYLKKYKASSKEYPPLNDERFKRYDAAAIDLNEKYQTVLYARSILPLITTVFLAVGFYAETLIGKTWSFFSQTAGMAEFAAHFALVLAGAGFLIHGLLNLYVYRLSVNRKIARWHTDFTENRFMAELYRLKLQLSPYSVDLNIRSLCREETFEDKQRINILLHTDDDQIPTDKTIDKRSGRELLTHLDEMIDEQIAYHSASETRYEGIVRALGKWSKVIFYISFVMILLRAVLQFVLALSPIAAVGGFDLNAWVRSFANFLALFLPAWAGYFTSKREQNNFNYNLENHRAMKQKLTAMRQRVSRLIENERTGLEEIYSLVNDLSEAMIVEDTLEWKRKYKSSTVKPL